MEEVPGGRGFYENSKSQFQPRVRILIQLTASWQHAASVLLLVLKILVDFETNFGARQRTCSTLLACCQYAGAQYFDTDGLNFVGGLGKGYDTS